MEVCRLARWTTRPGGAAFEYAQKGLRKVPADRSQRARRWDTAPDCSSFVRHTRRFSENRRWSTIMPFPPQSIFVVLPLRASPTGSVRLTSLERLTRAQFVLGVSGACEGFCFSPAL